MQRSEPKSSPLDRVGENLDDGTTEALKILGNEIRMAILLAFWEEADNDQPPWRGRHSRFRNSVTASASSTPASSIITSINSPGFTSNALAVSTDRSRRVVFSYRL